MVNKLKVDFLKDIIYIVGDWKLNSPFDFPKRRFLAGDTETKLYLNNELLDDDKAYELYKTKGQQWVKENIEVKPYAFMLSDGKDLVVAQNAEDFLILCAMFQVKRVFWYNSKFDFAIFDYYFLTHNWTQSQEVIEGKTNRGHLPAKTYQSLNGDFGQRYQLRIWQECLNRNYKRTTREFKFVDVCNVFGGGLARNLEDWDIEDYEGHKIRKLEMDYSNGDIEKDINYLINDTKGLYLLAEKIDKTIFDLCSLSFFKGDYITAGGLAKKVLLEKMFKQGTQYKNIKLFKQFFPITIEEDKEYRKHHLYLGGKCLVNPYKLNKPQTHIFKYDVNSMYPAQMYKMLYPVGEPKLLDKIKDIKEDNEHVYILKLKYFTGILKPQMIPVYQDTLTNEYNSEFMETDYIYMWYDELKELEKWYYLNYNVEAILEFEAKSPKGTKEYINLFYGIKCNSKGAIKNGAKLFLNSAYGKIAQRVERVICNYVLSDKGYVILEKTGSQEDEKSMLSVVVGSRITSLARVCLMKYIRHICNGNVKDNFIYCDTDSVHALTEYKDTDDKELGKMKNEGVFSKGTYLAPKSYLLYSEKTNKYEVHCKGVNTKIVANEIKGQPFEVALNIFKPNRTFKCLMGLNVRGGKALIYVDKMIVNEENILKVLETLGDLEEIDEQ